MQRLISVFEWKSNQWLLKRSASLEHSCSNVLLHGVMEVDRVYSADVRQLEEADTQADLSDSSEEPQSREDVGNSTATSETDLIKYTLNPKLSENT